MKLRWHVIRILVWKDLSRLLRNGPALMLLGLLVVVAFLTASSGVTETARTQRTEKPAVSRPWIVYQDEDDWVKFLKRRAPQALAIRFVEVKELGQQPYPNTCVIELRPPLLDQRLGVHRQHVRYRFPGSDPNVLWPVTRWFLAASVEYFGPSAGQQ